MSTFYSPDGNPEMWDVKPDGYYTEAEWEAMHPPTPPTLDETKIAKREELKRTRDEVILQGFLFAGYVFPLDQDVQVSMMQQLMASQMMPPPEQYIYRWKDIEGIYRDIGNTAMFQYFIAAAMSYGKSFFDWEEMLQELVNAATTVEEVAAITWDTVPDEPV